MPPSDFLRPLVLSGPSGTGKSTLLKRLFQEFPEKFGFSVSRQVVDTTRSPRPGEADGIAYHFVPRERFQELIDQGAFIEYAEYSGNLYGTSFAAVADVAKSGRRCILDIDSQGVKSLKRANMDSFYLFVSPPSKDALRERLQARGTETEDAVQSRLQAAIAEFEYAQQPDIYDAVVVNDDLARAYEAFKKISLGESRAADSMPAIEL